MELLKLVQIIIAILLITVILMQNRGGGLSGVFGGGGGGNVYMTKRGFEKTLFIYASTANPKTPPSDILSSPNSLHLSFK